MSIMLGFQQYSNLENIQYMDVLEETPKAKRRGVNDDLLDMVYCIDPVTGFPSGAISQYLSDKTNDQVRSFIERHLLNDSPDNQISVPQNLREQLLNLDSEFIAKTSRNRFESKEQYEDRVQQYFKELEEDKAKWKEVARLRKKYETKKSEDD